MHALLQTLTGYRDDVNLPDRWWHRLAKVVCILAIPSAVVLIGVKAWSGAPEAASKNIRVTATLDELMNSKERPVVNAAAALVDLPGMLGVLQDDGGLRELHATGLTDSYCSPDAYLALDDIAAHLNKEPDTDRSTPETVLVDVQAQAATPPARLCWFDKSITSQLQDAAWTDIAKYEFTSRAIWQARIVPFLLNVGLLLLAYFVAVNVYNRGLVYVICGPRTKALAPVAETKD